MKKLKAFICSVLLITTTSVLLTAPNTAVAQTQRWEDLEQDIGGTEGYCVVGGVATIQGTMCLLANLLSVALTVIGLAGFVMMVVGSLTWLVSGGSSQNVEKARKTMTFAIIGLVVALSSFIIINIISSFTGIDLTEFVLPSSETGMGGMGEWENL